MMPTNSSRVQPVPDRRLVPAGSWRDAWLAALGYLFYLWVGAGGALLSALSGLFHLTSETRGILGAGIGMAILVIDFIVVLLCWRGGWPRWSLPYLGIVLTWLVFFAQAMIRNDGSLLIFTPPLVFFIIFLLAALGWWWKGLHSLYERLNSDWTLIGLAYFSCGPFLFFILLNETRYEARGNLVLSVILALGVFAYMRSASLWQRMVVLPVIFTAACLVAAFYMQADYNGWLPYFRILISWDAVAIAPLLIIGILELGRYAFSRWLQAA